MNSKEVIILRPDTTTSIGTETPTGEGVTKTIDLQATMTEDPWAKAGIGIQTAVATTTIHQGKCLPTIRMRITTFTGEI